MYEKIRQFVKESAKLSETMAGAASLLANIEKAAVLTLEAFRRGNKILVLGNGGSAAEAQHFAAEFVNRYKLNRNPWPAIALTTDTSAITSIANDFGYEYIFSKQIEALGQAGDVLFVLTTSDVSLEKGGHSANMYHGLLAAKKKGLIRIGLVSEKSQEILKLLDVAIIIPSKNTPRIQEAHLLALHSICEIVEKEYAKVN